MKTINTLIISKLNNILKQKNITQKDLGNGIGVSKTTINNWINDRSKIDAVSLKRISDFLKVPITYFFTDENIIKLALGHSNNDVTAVYIDYDDELIDDANEKVIAALKL